MKPPFFWTKVVRKIEFASVVSWAFRLLSLRLGSPFDLNAVLRLRKFDSRYSYILNYYLYYYTEYWVLRKITTLGANWLTIFGSQFNNKFGKFIGYTQFKHL